MNRIITDMADAFNGLNRREQIVVLCGGFALSLYLIWQAVIMPIHDMRQSQLDRTKGLAITLAQVESMAGTLLAEAKQTLSQPSGGGSIAELVDRTLQTHGLRMAGFQPGSNGEVRLRLDNVTYSGLSQWLYALEFTHFVQVRELSVTASATEGLIMVNVRLRKE